MKSVIVASGEAISRTGLDPARAGQAAFGHIMPAAPKDINLGRAEAAEPFAISADGR